MSVFNQITHEYKSLFNSWKKLRKHRKEYKIQPTIGFVCDRNLFVFSILPVIVWEPWMYRNPNTYVVDIRWLNFHIGLGLWTPIP